MTRTIDDYTKRQFEVKLQLFLDELTDGAVPSEMPCAVLLGGQSGAGKTRLHDLMKVELQNNVIVINGDEYRRAHPNFMLIQQQYGVDAPAHTAKWSGAMTEALIDALSAQGFNLVIEGTLRTSEVPLRTAALLRQRGYSVSLAIMAVKPEISLVSCQIRYEMMRLAGTTPRSTDPAHHDKIVHQIVGNLGTLEASGAFDAIRLFDRSARCLYPTPGTASAAEVLESRLFGDWTDEERAHYAYLQAKLQQLKDKP